VPHAPRIDRRAVSCVWSGVRHAGLASVLVIAATAATARAEGDEPRFLPVGARSLALGFEGHAGRIGGVSEAGYGGYLELALGAGRWQPFVDGALATTGVNSWTAPAADTRVDGAMMRGGLGVRWIAAQFVPDPSGAVELAFETFAGIERYTWHDGSRLRRPDLGVGVATQIRIARPFHLTFRIGMRVVFAPSDRDGPWVACRSSSPDSGCDAPPAQQTSSAGFLTQIGFAWW
jgi:hypothetical protein